MRWLLNKKLKHSNCFLLLDQPLSLSRHSTNTLVELAASCLDCQLANSHTVGIMLSKAPLICIQHIRPMSTMGTRIIQLFSSSLQYCSPF